MMRLKYLLKNNNNNNNIKKAINQIFVFICVGIKRKLSCDDSCLYNFFYYFISDIKILMLKIINDFVVCLFYL